MKRRNMLAALLIAAALLAGCGSGKKIDRNEEVASVGADSSLSAETPSDSIPLEVVELDTSSVGSPDDSETKKKSDKDDITTVLPDPGLPDIGQTTQDQQTPVLDNAVTTVSTTAAPETTTTTTTTSQTTTTTTTTASRPADVSVPDSSQTETSKTTTTTTTTSQKKDDPLDPSIVMDDDDSSDVTFTDDDSSSRSDSSSSSFGGIELPIIPIG